MAVKRVLIVTGWFPTAAKPVGGVFVRHQAEALADAGLAVRVLHLRSSGADADQVPIDDTNRALAVETFGIADHRVRAIAEARSALRIMKTIRDFRPDVIHAHVFDVGLSAVVAGHLLRVPVVVTEHWSRVLRGLRWFERPRARITYRRADRVLAVGESLARGVRDLCGRTDVVVIPNVVALGGPLADGGLLPPPFHLISVGSLTEVKDHSTLIDAVAAIALDGDPDVRLAIAGDGPDLAALHARVREAGIEHLVEFVGQVDPAGVADLLRRSHIFVLSSRIETFSVATAEALSVGLPVVVTQCGGPEDFVGAEDGVVVPVGDPSALTRGITEVITRLDDWNSPAIAARARGRFAPDQVAGRLIAVFETVQRPRRRRRSTAAR